MESQIFDIRSAVSGSFVMPGEIISLLPKINETQLKVFVYCMAEKQIDVSAASEALGIPSADISEALGFWKAAGLFGCENKKAVPSAKGVSHTSLIQSYDASTLAEAMENEPDFSSLKNTVEDMIGKVMNKNDINLLYNIYSFSGLSADFVCTVAAYAVGRGKANMRYIAQTALSLYDEGVDTFDKLENTLAERRKRDSIRDRFITLCGFGSRRLSPKEEEYITRWFSEFELPFEVVSVAYEKMIDTIHEVKLSYLDKIITDWHGQGVTTEEQARAVVIAGQGKGKPRGDTVGEASFDINEFLEAAFEKGVN